MKNDPNLYRFMTPQISMIESLQKNSVFSRAIESAANCIVITNAEAQIEYVNPAFERVTGYRADEVIGKNPRILKSGLLDQQFYQEMWRILSSGKSFRSTLVNKKKNGDLYYTDQTIDPICSSEGTITHYVSVFSDITERVDLENRLKRALQEVVRSNQELEQFAYIASHDLQEPLRMIGSFTQLLEKKYGSHLDEQAREYIFYAVDGARRMQNLVDDLLTYSRVGTQGKPMSLVDVGPLLDHVLKDLDLLIREHQAVIRYTDMPVITADAVQMDQIFQNLIRNAIKFKRPGMPPRVQISCESRTDDWLFCVEDNGIGIEEKYLEKIFVIFQRLHARDQYPGTGIGLAVCKRIAERHGGTIWAESNLASGSRFYFTISKMQAD